MIRTKNLIYPGEWSVGDIQPKVELQTYLSDERTCPKMISCRRVESFGNGSGSGAGSSGYILGSGLNGASYKPLTSRSSALSRRHFGSFCHASQKGRELWSIGNLAGISNRKRDMSQDCMGT